MENLSRHCCLAEYGFTPYENPDFIVENIDAYELHVVKDLPVSKVYLYYQGADSEFYIDEACRTPIPIDPEERGGAYLIGIKKALTQAILNPNQVIVCFSPPGPVNFSEDKDNLYAKIDQNGGYHRGQIYLVWSEDGRVVKNIALTVGRENDGLVRFLVNHPGYSTEFNRSLDRLKAEDVPLEERKALIFEIITTPVNTSCDIDSLVDKINADLNETIVYQSVNDRVYRGKEVSELIRQSIQGRIEGELKFLYGDAVREIQTLGGITENKIYDLYRDVLLAYMTAHNLETLPLGGSCGGKEVSLTDLRGNFPLETTMIGFFSSLFEGFLYTGPFSTTWRNIQQSENNKVLKCVTCPECNQVVDAIREGDEIICPNCGATKRLTK